MLSFKKFLNKEQLLTEGGASGHMANLFEDPQLTFGQLKTIFKKIFTGKIEISEKTDGVALAITVKNGKVYAARNKATLKKPLSLKELDVKFSDRSPNIRKAFVNSMAAVSKAIQTLSIEEQDSIFNDGHNYMAFEIIDPEAKNILDYGNRLCIQFHGINEYDQNWNKIGDNKEAAKKLYDLLNAHGALNIDQYEIKGPQILTFKNNVDSKQALNILISEVDDVVSKNQINDKTNLEKFVYGQYKQYVDKLVRESPLKLSDKTREKLAWYGMSENLSQHTKNKTGKKDIAIELHRSDPKVDIKSKEFLQIITDIDKTKKEKNQEFIAPIESVIIKAGVYLLESVEGFLSMHPDQTSKQLTKELQDTIKLFKTNPEKYDEKKVEAFKKNIKRLGEWENKEVSPAEGVVFLYKGKVYKMTGTFGPINQIVNLLRY